MSPIWFIATFIVILIIQKLFSSLGKNEKQETIRGVLPVTGQVFEMTIKEQKKRTKETPNFDEKAFLLYAKMTFDAITDAFSKGNKTALKNLLTKPIFQFFSQMIDEREKKEQTVDFSLIAINSAKIVSTNSATKPTRITTEFQTEQVNILRDKEGKILEGDAIQIAHIKDTWVFEKQSGIHNNWLVSATKSEGI